MLAKSTMQSLPFALANCTGTKCNGLAANEDDKIATKYNMQKKNNALRIVSTTLKGLVDEAKAINFEQYLKSGSGRAFANKRLW